MMMANYYIRISTYRATAGKFRIMRYTQVKYFALFNKLIFCCFTYIAIYKTKQENENLLHLDIATVYVRTYV